MRYPYKICLIVLMILSFLLVVNCSAAKKSDFEENYEILLQKNIFSKNRSMIFSQTEDDANSPEETIAEDSPLRYILRGVSSVDGLWVAFFEDIITGLCSIVHVDDDFNDGKIKSISAQGLIYEIEEQQIDIQIGSDLTGADSISNSAEDSSEDSTEVSEEDNDILKRLMERRKKQLDQ